MTGQLLNPAEALRDPASSTAPDPPLTGMFGSGPHDKRQERDRTAVQGRRLVDDGDRQRPSDDRAC